MRIHMVFAAFGALGWAPAVARTQQPASPSVERAAATITAKDVARRVGIIAADSMMGRDTPSRGLDLTAQYVADEFRRFGLIPAGDSGSFLQRYPLSWRRMDFGRSAAVLEGPGGLRAEFRFDASVGLIFGDRPTEPLVGQLVVLSGVDQGVKAPPESVRGRIALIKIDFGRGRPPKLAELVFAMREKGAKALVLVETGDSAGFARLLRVGAQPFATLESADATRFGLTVLRALEDSIAAHVPVLADSLRSLQAMASEARPLDDWRATITARDTLLERTSAPNVVGMLPGADPTLGSQYLVFSAHMDHVGITPGQPDSINNGADDNASGTAGVIELAEAFSRPDARPKRSILFLTVSGEEKYLWGSEYFTTHPPVPLSGIIADLNIDMIGRNWKDTIVAIGKEHSDLGASLERVSAAHPELRMTAIDDIWPEQRSYFRSDHYNFARRGVPILFFTSGEHPDYHKVTDSPEKIDSEKESRILRLLFFLGHYLGDSPLRPQWRPDSYQEIVQLQDAR